MLKIASWNVNSLRARITHVLEWLETDRPEVLALQETKLEDELFPTEAFVEAGYTAVFSGQKAYNGVALLSTLSPRDVSTELPGVDNDQSRLVAASYGDIRVLNVYVPNGQAVGSDKYTYKLAWLDGLRQLVQRELREHAQLVVLGDFNVAPDDQDVHDPELWEGSVLCSEPERAAFRRLLELGLADSFRLFDQPPDTFSWWDYRAGAFRRNLGLRIDLILVSAGLRPYCVRSRIDTTPRKRERPSDHAPVVAEFDLD